MHAEAETMIREAPVKGHTIKSNCRRAARKAGLDPDALAIAQGADGLWRYAEPADEGGGATGAAAADHAGADGDAAAPDLSDLPGDKLRTLAALLLREEGVTLVEGAAATGWKAWTVRGRLSDLGRLHGFAITRDEDAIRGRVYRATRGGKV